MRRIVLWFFYLIGSSVSASFIHLPSPAGTSARIFSVSEKSTHGIVYSSFPSRPWQVAKMTPAAAAAWERARAAIPGLKKSPGTGRDLAQMTAALRAALPVGNPRGAAMVLAAASAQGVPSVVTDLAGL